MLFHLTQTFYIQENRCHPLLGPLLEFPAPQEGIENIPQQKCSLGMEESSDPCAPPSSIKPSVYKGLDNKTSQSFRMDSDSSYLYHLFKNHRTILLSGPVGAGKTTLVQWALKKESILIQSPSFPIVIPHTVSWGTFCHIDLYRLPVMNNPESLWALGIEPFSHQTFCIEWPGRAPVAFYKMLPTPMAWLRIVPHNPPQRLITGWSTCQTSVCPPPENPISLESLLAQDALFDFC